MAYLRSAGLVSTRRDGKWIYYGIENQTDAAVARVLDATLRSVLSDGSEVKSRPENDYGHVSDRSYVNDPTISSEGYTDDWAPAEMEIYLL